MSYSDYVLQDQRLVMLRLLDEMPSYTSNSSVMCKGLASIGHTMSRDKVKTELRWLEEQGLVEITPAETVLVAKLTERGQDVAHGRSVVDGVHKPRA